MEKRTQNNEEISLGKLRAGDRAEFVKVVDTYSDLIYRLAMKMLGDTRDAEDVMQETFLKAFRSIENFRGGSSVSTWLYRIATNEALMMIRKRKPESYPVELDQEPADSDYQPVEIVDWGELPEDRLLTAENIDYLNKLVQLLSPALRIVFLLRDVMELSVRETGEVLGITETAVKTRLSRARLQLRQDLSRFFDQSILEKGK